MNPLLFWTLPGLIDILASAKADGTEPTTRLDSTQLNNPNGIALDLENGHLYIADGGAGDRLLRANLDGSNGQVIIPNAGDNPADLALDLGNGQIYWIIPGATDAVRRANLDGSNIETLLDPSRLENPNGLVLDVAAGPPYVADGGAEDVILRANADTDSDPDSRDVTIGDPGTTNLDDFTIRPIPGFTSTVTVSEGATEARLVVTPFPDDRTEDPEVISLSLLPGATTPSIPRTHRLH